MSSGKPLKDFKQRDDMTKLAFLGDPLGFYIENDLEGAHVHMMMERHECIRDI